MSKTAEAKIKNGKARKKLWGAYLEEDEMAFVEAIGEVEKTYHQSRLSELRERVESIKASGDFTQLVSYDEAYNDGVKAVLNLIDNMEP